MDEKYKYKYLKYKNKYLELKSGGAITIKYDNEDFFLDFNTKKNIILEKYENFSDINFVKDNIKRLSTGDNGTVVDLLFTKKISNRKKDKMDIIMKTPHDETKDNTYYEYVNGLCVNRFKELFPNFAYTFGFGYISPALKLQIERDDVDDDYSIESRFFIENYLVNNSTDEESLKYTKIKNGCQFNGSTSILTEKIPNSKEFYNYLIDPDFINSPRLSYNLFCILYQIYLTLNSLQNYFTHYDLHTSNIIISKYDEPIKIIYRLADGNSITLYTRYIPVLIDYGRAFVNCLKKDSNINSFNYLNNACNIEECRDDLTTFRNCELKNGLYMKKINKDVYDTVNDWFSYNTPHKINKSHDLRLIHDLMDRIHVDCEIKNYYATYFSQALCPEWFNADGELKTGVLEQPDGFADHRIKNINDCLRFLERYYITRDFEGMHGIPENECLGVMTIYEDKSRNWEFRKTLEV